MNRSESGASRDDLGAASAGAARPPLPTASCFARAVVACCLLAVSCLAQAHGVWFAQRSGQMALVYGHGAEDLDMVRRFERVREVRAFDASGAPVEAAALKGAQLVTIDMSAKPAVLAAVLDNGYWSKRPDGSWVNRGRDEVPDAKENGRFVKYAVRIEGSPTAALAPIAGQVLQVLPVSARLPRHANEPMTVRVLFQGRPVAGARVVRDYVNDPDAKPMVTGKDGAVNVDNGFGAAAAALRILRRLQASPG